MTLRFSGEAKRPEGFSGGLLAEVGNTKDLTTEDSEDTDPIGGDAPP